MELISLNSLERGAAHNLRLLFSLSNFLLNSSKFCKWSNNLYFYLKFSEYHLKMNLLLILVYFSYFVLQCLLICFCCLVLQNERNLIISSLDQPENASSKDFSIPWRHVLTSGPFLAIFVAHVCSNFGWYMLLIELPTYMKQVLKFDIQQVSFC